MYFTSMRLWFACCSFGSSQIRPKPSQNQDDRLVGKWDPAVSQCGILKIYQTAKAPKTRLKMLVAADRQHSTQRTTPVKNRIFIRRIKMVKKRKTEVIITIPEIEPK